MTFLPRRAVLTGLAGAACAGLSACSNAIGTNGTRVIDARVDATRRYLFQTHPQTRGLAQQSAGELTIPVVTQAAFGAGGSYGRGSLLLKDTPVDYYAATNASLGVQIGAQQYAHTMFFMTEGALQSFRLSPGWVAGADVEWVLADRGGNISANTLTVLSPVIGLVYGQAGLLAGAAVDGTKYTRIIP